MKISIQGELGAYSHQALIECFPKATPIPHQTFEGAFEAVKNDEADLAMIPIENSTYGRVSDVHYLLPNADLNIVGEHFLRIRINWLAKKGAKQSQIKRAISHPVLLGQCRHFMRAHNLTWESWSDTAAAAKFVAESSDPDISAFSSPLAAKLYNLDVLAEGVEDFSNNTTRFLILSKDKDYTKADKKVVTSFIFEIRNIPAALYKALGGFATNKINMTKLESYMVGGHFIATQFFAEIEGHPDDHAVQLAFQELSFFTHSMKILGVYPASKFRD